MARWINDEEKKPNCVMKKHVFNGKVHLCLFGLVDIGINEELRYNYGMKDLPWRQVRTWTQLHFYPSSHQDSQSLSLVLNLVFYMYM